MLFRSPVIEKENKDSDMYGTMMFHFTLADIWTTEEFNIQGMQEVIQIAKHHKANTKVFPIAKQSGIKT